MDLDSALTGKSADPADVTQVLRDDHGEIRRLIAEYRDAEHESMHARRVIMEAIAMQAELHTRIEEDVVYPAVQRLCPDFVEHALEAHGAVTAKGDALQALDPSEPEYGEIAHQLIDSLAHHMDEEERTLFPILERDMAGEQARLGEALIRRKEELTRSVEDLEGPAT
jgi:hemerythrin-like domain-containing protein